MLFGGSGKIKIESADDLIKALKGEPGEPGGEGNGVIDIIKDEEDKLIFKMLYGQEIIIESVKGDKGDKGLTGKAGKDGKDGYGFNGADGANGTDGSNGKNGVNGINGLDGSNGKDGKDGKDGLNGLHGKNGLDGKDGLDGGKGDPGERGDPGEQGAPGKDGKDAPLSKWLKIQELEFTTDSEEFSNIQIIEAGGDKLFTVKAFVEAKAEGSNAWFVGEKAFIINVEKASVNTAVIIPEQKTHDQFGYDVKFINSKPVLVAKSLATNTEWKARLEVYAL